MNRFEPDDVEIVFGLPPHSLNFDVIAIDTEWFNQETEKLHRPHGDFGCLGCTFDGKKVYMIFDTDEIQQFYDRISEGMHVYHNAKYDLTQLRPYANIPDRKKIWDTQIVEMIRFSGYYTDFALNDLVRRYLRMYLDKSERESFSQSDNAKMSDDQIFYAACDIVATWHVAQAQRDEIDEDDLNIWKHIERDFLWTLLDTKGAYFDAESWTERYTADLIAAEELDKKLPFNPRSPKQVKEYFKDKYKLKLDGTAEAVLMEVAKEHPEIEELQQILEARGLSKAAKTYGAGWVENMEADHRIYPNWKQIGTESGRVSAPGLFPIQTMPHEEKYRKCIMAAPDHSLVINDYSSQEPRLLAYITGDPTLIDIFQQDKDIYIEVGYQVFGERFDKKDPRRQQMKAIILGVSYGMSKYGLARKLEIDVDDAQALLDKFFEKFPKVAEWVESCAQYKPYVTTVLGRKFWLNPYSNGWERNAQNFPMQGSAGDCSKRAANKLRKKLGFNPIIVYLHDEFVSEYPNDKLEECAAIQTEVMVSTQTWLHETIPGKTDQFIGQNWSAK